MALEHVAQDAARVVVAGPFADGQLLGDGDLHVVDVTPIPQRLEQRVCQSKHEDVLNSVLAQVMIDAIDLLLSEVQVQVVIPIADKINLLGSIQTQFAGAGLRYWISPVIEAGEIK